MRFISDLFATYQAARYPATMRPPRGRVKRKARGAAPSTFRRPPFTFYRVPFTPSTPPPRRPRHPAPLRPIDTGTANAQAMIDGAQRGAATTDGGSP